MFNVGIISCEAEAAFGEAVLLTTQVWVCPPGVTSVSAVLVGKGGNGVLIGGTSFYTGGGGGALVYRNEIPVVPGQSYQATINSTATSIFGMQAGAGTDGKQQPASGPSGGIGGTASSGGTPTARWNGASSVNSQNYSGGGDSATYTSNGQGRTGQGVMLDRSDVAGPYGAGGSSGTGTLGGAQPGGAGAIRIIWGTGRSYPNNAA